MARKPEKVFASSGNVFADMGFENPEQELTKARLVGLIWGAIERLKLTQRDAGDLMGVDQPKVSALMRGRTGSFSTERLLRMIAALGMDNDITVKAKHHSRRSGRIRIFAEAGTAT